MRRGLTAAVLLVALSAWGAAAQDAECSRWRGAFASMPVRSVSIDSGARVLPIRVRVADRPEQQAAGFQCATPHEIQEHLIFFDFGREIVTQFHMQNVPAPLDIAFAKANGRIFAILQMEPSPAALYGPLGPFRYALEARAGFFASQGIRPGDARLVIDQ